MIQRSRSDWSCIFLQFDVVCPSLSLSLPGRYNSFCSVINIVGKACIQVRTVKRQKTNITAKLYFLRRTPFFTNSYARSIKHDYKDPVREMSARCQCPAQSTINLQMFRAIFPPNASSSAKKCKKWQWSENFTETSGMKKLPRKGLRTERGNMSVQLTLPLCVCYFFLINSCSHLLLLSKCSWALCCLCCILAPCWFP